MGSYPRSLVVRHFPLGIIASVPDLVRRRQPFTSAPLSMTPSIEASKSITSKLRGKTMPGGDTQQSKRRRQDSTPHGAAQQQRERSLPNLRGLEETRASLNVSPTVRGLATDRQILNAKNARGEYDWSSFRGTLTDTDETNGRGERGARTEGRGAEIEGGQHGKSVVIWGPIAPSSGEGTSMKATIGPDHNLGSPPTNDAAKKRVQAFNIISPDKNAYIAGHLLAEKLGGPGSDPRNLTAITRSANAEHSTEIEKPVREMVNLEGYWMNYSVIVEYKTKNIRLDSRKASALTQIGASGIKVTRNIAKVIYASKLETSCSQLDNSGKPAGKHFSANINIPPPSDNTKSEAVIASIGDSDDGSDVIKTNIGHSDLVLTETSELRSSANTRETLVKYIEILEEQVKAEYDRGYQDGLRAREEQNPTVGQKRKHEYVS